VELSSFKSFLVTPISDKKPSILSILYSPILWTARLILAWSQLTDIQTPPVVTTDFVYLRLIGDRSINENEFGMIQKDRTEEMQKWAHKLRIVEEEAAAAQVKLAVVSANNHYAGFGPATANMLRKMLDLHPVDWTENIQDIKSDSSQRSIYDFV
jgi:uncharacterized protein YecE (DUF72 family)